MVGDIAAPLRRQARSYRSVSGMTVASSVSTVSVEIELIGGRGTVTVGPWVPQLTLGVDVF